MAKRPNLAPPWVVCWRCRQDVANGSYVWVRISATREVPICRKVCEPPYSKKLTGKGTIRLLRPERKHAPIVDLTRPRRAKYKTLKPPSYSDLLLEAANQLLKHLIWDKRNPDTPHPRWARVPLLAAVRLEGAVFTAKLWREHHPEEARAADTYPPYLEPPHGAHAEPPY